MPVLTHRRREACRRSILPCLLAGALSLAALPAFAQTAGVATDLPQDLSPVAMFMAADIVVKGVMVLLGAASFLTWLTWLAKSLELAISKHRARRGVVTIESSIGLVEALRSANGRSGAVAEMIRAAAAEQEMTGRVADHAAARGLKERIAMVLERLEAHHAGRMARGTGLLATVGSVAPFVGLFGTVWGIMNAFIGISRTQTTNLAVVAPGIAEALLATAIGLVAAIPAVVIYNLFVRSITGYRRLLGDASSGIARLVSRDLDRLLAVEAQVRADQRIAAE